MSSFLPRRWSGAKSPLLHAMLERLRIDLGAAWKPRLAGRMHGVIRGCRRCLDPSRCEAWLESNGPPEERYCFCPNASTLDTLPRRY